jgi:sucrose phosphorylase
MVTVLDTHDGIGIVDVGANPLRPGIAGLLTDSQIDALVEAIHNNSKGTSRLATGAAATNLDLYQVNSTFYDALGRDDRRYLLARLIQLFLPGIPQIYYVGLMAGGNDVDLLQRTGAGRDINRRHYPPNEIAEQMHRPVVRAQLAAIRMRSQHPAFLGAFAHQLTEDRLTLDWTDDVNRATLRIDFSDLSHHLTSVIEGREATVDDLMTFSHSPDWWTATIGSPA